jgi:cellulose synthase/poly-beta-1,6-N-acetylglucosamine synthase-like glycosyltransferase
VISVLLPYRNAAATIAEAAASVIADLEAGDELVAIDDGSTDGSRAALDSLQDARIRHVQTAGVRIAKALTAGLAIARGELVGRMDADDVSLPDRFSAERTLLESDPSLGVAAVQAEAFGVEAEGLARYLAWQNGIVTAEEHAAAMFIESPIIHPATLIRRTALEAAGGWQDPPWAEDWDLWLRIHRAGFGIAKAPRVLFRWRRAPSTMTVKDPRFTKEALLACRAHHLAAELGAREFAIWGAGDAGRRLSAALATHGARPSFFVDIDPKKIGGTRAGRPIVSAEEGIARGAFLVVCVATPGARDVVRARLVAAGRVERRDFVCAA